MNQDLQKKLLELIEGGQLAVKQKGPEIVAQLITYNTVMAWAGIALGILLLALALWVWWVFEDEAKFIFVFVVAASSVPILACNIDTLVQMRIAPDLYVMQQLSGVLK